jgi:hypothetical protein
VRGNGQARFWSGGGGGDVFAYRNNGKDQCMTCLKLALANLGMWSRDQYFPATYAHATWHRLLPFFRLPGRVTEGKQAV